MRSSTTAARTARPAHRFLAAAAVLAALLPSARAAEVPLDMSYGHPSIEVTLNGRGPYRLLVDSGAHPPLTIDADLAAELNLPLLGKDRVGDPTNPEAIDVNKVRVDRIEVAGRVYEGVAALSWKIGLYTGPDRPRGVIGLPLFGDALVTFDYPAGRLRIEDGSLPPADGRTVLPATLQHGIPTIPLDVAGRTLTAHLDTGSMAGITLPSSLAAELPLAAPLREIGRARTINSERIISEAPLKGSVRLGGWTIVDPGIHFNDDLPPNVGSALLKFAVVTIDRKNERVRVEPGPDAAAAAAPMPRFGIRMAPRGSGARLEIAGVDPGSRAEAAGLIAGDAILKIDGRDVSGIGPADIARTLRGPSFVLTIERAGKEMEINVRPPA